MAIVKYAFVHIPKCGGTTFHSLLGQTFKEGEVFHAGSPSEVAYLKENVGNIEDKYQVIGAHMNVLQFIKLELDKRKFLCLIRDPIARFSSLYSHVRERKVHPLNSQAQFGPEAFLDSLLEDPVQSRQLYLCHWICGERSFEKAWSVLEKLDIKIADLSFFKEYYKYLCDYEGWPVVRGWEMKNVRNQSLGNDLPTLLRMRLEILFEDDIKLRERVLKLREFSI